MQQMKLLLLTLCVAALAACSGSRTAQQTTPAADAFKVDPATAGTITGRVQFTGTKPLPKPINLSSEPECARQHQGGLTDEEVVAAGDGALANAFVYIKRGLEDKKFTPASDEVVIDQRGCWFGPRVLGIQVGQTLKVTNSDPVSHNIHPMPAANREWNQNQPPGAVPFIRRFTQAEVMIPVKCNIHSWMHAWVGVTTHPYFAVTGADGSFTLKNVPPGTYTLEVWQEALGKQEQQVTLAPSGKSEVSFQFKDNPGAKAE